MVRCIELKYNEKQWVAVKKILIHKKGPAQFEREVQNSVLAYQAKVGLRIIMAWICGIYGYIAMEELPSTAVKWNRYHKKKSLKRKALKAALARMRKVHLAHGDMTVNNVFYNVPVGKVIVIDWGHALTVQQMRDQVPQNTKLRHRLGKSLRKLHHVKRLPSFWWETTSENDLLAAWESFREDPKKLLQM